MDAVPGGERLQKTVVVGVFEASLQHVVVDVTNRQAGPDAWDAHGLELQIGDGSGGILGEGLINPHTDLLTSLELALRKMLGEYLADQVRSHATPFLDPAAGQRFTRRTSLHSLTRPASSEAAWRR